jgi:hypothetical protein
MLIRHGEKPSADGTVAGVTAKGEPSPDELSVRGWQRAGALVRFFAPISGAMPMGIATPTHLIAQQPTAHAPSLRACHTLAPLSGLIGLPVQTKFAKGQEGELAAAIATLDGVVLVAWEHKALRAIAVSMAGSDALPLGWPDDRFDVVWSFEQIDDRWDFLQVPQMLLPGDRAETF